jgi:hypothetical protein
MLREDVEGAYIPVGNLVTMISVRFAIPTDLTKQTKKELKN